MFSHHDDFFGRGNVDYFHCGGNVDNDLRDNATLHVEFARLLAACGPLLLEFVKIENQNRKWVFTRCSKIIIVLLGFGPMKGGYSPRVLHPR